jgi:hypothetical protein
MKSWKAAALFGALLVGACSKEPAPEQDSKPAEAPAAAEKPAAAPQAEAAESEEEPTPDTQAPEEPGPPPEFKLGQSRSEVMALFADCAERRQFTPAGPNSLYVEIYQAKDTAPCRQRLGERHFVIRGGQLFQVNDGLLPPPAPVRQEPPPEM